MALAAQYERLDSLWERRLCLQHNRGLFKSHMQKLHTSSSQDVHLKQRWLTEEGAMSDDVDRLLILTGVFLVFLSLCYVFCLFG